MLTSQHDYRLIAFGEDAASAEEYAQAERVYLDSIGSTARTKTHEIAYWRDRYNSKFSKTGDKLFVYGFEHKSEMVGFALMFYYPAHNLVVFDHIAIKEPARHLGVFFEFKRLIAQDFLERRIQVDFVLAEIVTSAIGDPHPIDPQLLIQLLKQSGFKVAHIEYYTPSILEKEYDAKIEAALMVWRNDRSNKISSSLLSSLIDCVLDDLYVRWYSPHSRNLKGFKAQIDRLRAGYAEQLSQSESIELNGNWKIVHLPVRRETLPDKRKAQIAVRRTPPPPTLADISAPLYLFLATAMVASALAVTSHLLGLSILSVMAVFIGSLFVLMSLLAVWYPAAGKQTKNIARVLRDLLRHDKNIGR